MAVNKVDLNGETLIDLTADTATAEDVAEGKTFHLASGEQATGTSTSGSGSDLGIIEAMDEPLPTPEETDPYVVYDNDDLSAYVRKVRQTSANTIYPPNESTLYYAVILGTTGSSFSGQYKIVWASQEKITFSGGGNTTYPGAYERAEVRSISYYSTDSYTSIDEAETAIKSNTTPYTQATSLTYFYRTNTSAIYLSNPVVKTNINATISYVERLEKGSMTSLIGATYRDVNAYNPFSGYISGSVTNHYSKLLDSEDIPLPTDDDDGKALVVQDGKIVYENIVSLPTPTASDAGKVPTVNAAGDAYELQTPQSGGGGRYLHTIYFEDYGMYPYLKFYSASSSKITSGTTGEKQSAFSSVEGSALYIVSDGEMYGGVLTWDSAASAAKAVYFNGSGSATALSLSSIWGEETSEA